MRTTYADGIEPQVSPDGRTVAHMLVEQPADPSGGIACASVTLVVRDLAGAELQRPLAVTVIGGLALSTPVTLLLVPGLYAAFGRLTADA